MMNERTSLPATSSNDDGFNPIMPTDRVITGTLIKFVDGVWSESEIKISAGTKLLALSTHQVMQRWQDGRVVETISTKPLPDPDELNAQIPREQWEVDRNGNCRPPWQLTYVIYLLDPSTCEKFTFANGTVGTRIAIETLADRVAWMRRMRGSNVLPLVELSAKPMKTRFGTKQRPEFKIIEWHSLGGAVVTAPEQPALPSVKLPSSEEDMDDEILF
jgi:hypothetical protein